MDRIEQLNVEVFGGCNFSCRMCPQSRDLGGREREFLKVLPFAVFVKIIEDALAYGVKAVSLHGSGEATLNRDLVRMVKFAAERGLQPSIFTNGLLLTGEYFKRLAEAGLTLATVSLVGANRESYLKWMRRDSFETVIRNLGECREVMGRNPGQSEFHTRHLITEPERKDEEIRLYRQNVIEPLGCPAEIWMMHNWAGDYQSPYDRFGQAGQKRWRSCGRPFAPTLEVRAGGLNGHCGAVVPCPFVLGKDSQAVLGHLDDQSIAEVLAGEPLAQLRQAHSEEKFGDIPYCKNCDMLADDPEVLVWTNIPGRFVGQSKTSSVDYLAALASSGA